MLQRHGSRAVGQTSASAARGHRLDGNGMHGGEQLHHPPPRQRWRSLENHDLSSQSPAGRDLRLRLALHSGLKYAAWPHSDRVKFRPLFVGSDIDSSRLTAIVADAGYDSEAIIAIPT